MQNWLINEESDSIHRFISTIKILSIKEEKVALEGVKMRQGQQNRELDVAWQRCWGWGWS